MKIDFSKVAKEYREFRPTYPLNLPQMINLWTAQDFEGSALEVGCGAGQFTKQLVSLPLDLCAMDISHEMLEQARNYLADCANQPEFLVGNFCEFDFQTRTFNWIFVAQAWHLLNRVRAPKACYRILEETGKLVIVYNSRLEELSEIVQKTNRLIQQYNPNWEHDGHGGLYSDFMLDCYKAGFSKLESHSFDWQISYSIEKWVGRIWASKGVGASMAPELIEPFLEALKLELKPFFSSNPVMEVPHRIFCIVATK
jgi:SAM-dependent methyltransferase